MPSRIESALLLAFAIAILALLALAADPFPFFKDSGELASSIRNAGIAHPTGFPLHHVIAAAAVQLPLGPAPYRMALVSSVSIAAALFLVAFLVLVLGRVASPAVAESRPGALCQILVASAAGLALPACDTLWFHGLNIEVYASSLALSSFILFTALRALETGGAGWRNLFMLAGGLGAGMHVTCSLLFGLAFVVLAVSALASQGGRARGALFGLLFPGAMFYVLALVCLAYLPVRASEDPLRNWGDPSDWAGFLAHLTGRSIRTSFSEKILRLDWPHVAVYARLYAEQIMAQAGSLLPLALLGLVVVAARRRAAGFLLAAGLAADAGFSILINPMGQEDKQTSMLSLFLLASLAGAGGIVLLGKAASFGGQGRGAWLRGPRMLLVAIIAGVALLASPIASLSPEARASRVSSLAYMSGRILFQALPPDSLNVTGQDDLSAQTLYLGEVERRRPDSIHVIKQMVCQGPFMASSFRNAAAIPGAEELRSASEGVCSTIEPPQDEVAAVWRVLVPILKRGQVPVRWELGDGPTDSLVAPWLVPDFPSFALEWSREEGPARRPLEEFLPRYGRLARSMEEDLQDDISATVLSEYERLTGGFLLALAGSRDDRYVLAAACSFLRGATRLSKGNCRAWNNLSVCLSTLGKTEEATAASEAAVEACPLYSVALVNLIRFQLGERRMAEAEANLCRLGRDFPPGDYAFRLVKLKLQLEKAGRTDEAALVSRFVPQAQP
jgi:hypothetical protein